MFFLVKNLNENGTEQVKAATVGVKKPDLAHYWLLWLCLNLSFI